MMAGPVHAIPGAPDYAPTVLRANEMATLQAAMSRLVPADSESGGAVEACAHIYVDRALGGYLAQHLPAYRSGLAALDAVARTTKGTEFKGLEAADQDSLLSGLEGGRLGGALSDGGRSFFALLLRHTIEGMFSDPMYGGNLGFLGWQLIGFHGVQYFYSAEDQTINSKEGANQRSIASYGGQPKF
jgi:gluconate 2-dehydrogenase gamma chain